MIDVKEMFNKYISDEKISSPSSFLKGELDCLQGNEARDDMPNDYYRGYGSRYQMEQILGEISK